MAQERMTSKEIARELGISPHTVDQRIRFALRILGVRSRSEAALMLKAVTEAAGNDTRIEIDDIKQEGGHSSNLDTQSDIGPVYQSEDIVFVVPDAASGDHRYVEGPNVDYGSPQTYPTPEGGYASDTAGMEFNSYTAGLSGREVGGESLERKGNGSAASFSWVTKIALMVAVAVSLLLTMEGLVNTMVTLSQALSATPN